MRFTGSCPALKEINRETFAGQSWHSWFHENVVFLNLCQLNDGFCNYIRFIPNPIQSGDIIRIMIYLEFFNFRTEKSKDKNGRAQINHKKIIRLGRQLQGSKSS